MSNPQVMSLSDLKTSLSAKYYSHKTPKQSRALRQVNIESFLGINRKGLTHKTLEHRILMYSTQQGEKIHIQMPGKESIEATRMPYDFRPKLELANGLLMEDATFGIIWDILDKLGKEQRKHLSLIATVFLRMGYMYDYVRTCDSCECVALHIKDGVEEKSKTMPVNIDWYHLGFSDEIWYCLNNYIEDIPFSVEHSVSFEAFAKYVDLLIQNEDCKYYYKNVELEKKANYKLEHGRTSTCDANLLILDYLQENVRFSSLLNKFQQGKGMAKINKKDYPRVTGGIVTYN